VRMTHLAAGAHAEPQARKCCAADLGGSKRRPVFRCARIVVSEPCDPICICRTAMLHTLAAATATCFLVYSKTSDNCVLVEMCFSRFCRCIQQA
jgi:hypothetical protein